ncbi:MAG: hypothetical protein CMN28_05570 [Salinisphaeraceae bacterium]|nr:hypothetical protein [Salinisphaeraceae bacterium]
MSAIVLQSIDSPRRDFEWRLFIAAKLSQKNIASIIGNGGAVSRIHKYSKNCIYLGRLNSNTARSENDKRYLMQMMQNGTKVFFIHDEGGLYLKSDYEAAVRRVYPEEYFALSFFKKVFFWGDRQKRVFSQNGGNHEKFEIVGAPRLDLCRPKYAWIDAPSVESLHAKYGKYVLVCSRFSAMNPVNEDPSPISKRTLAIRIEGGDRREKSDILKFMFEAWGKAAYEYSHFVPMIAFLAIDFPDINFVVRPHPGEKEGFYNESLCHFDNVFIEKGGDVRPVIRAAMAVIHSECTTGIEAEICGIPNINFRPTMGNEKYDTYSVAGVSEVGDTAKGYLEVKEQLEKLRRGECLAPKNTKAVQDIVNNADGIHEACDLMASSIEGFVSRCGVESDIDWCRYQISFITANLTPKSLFKGMIKRMRESIRKLNVAPEANYSGDTKAYSFSEKRIRTLWQNFGGDPQSIKIAKGVVYTYPRDL